MYALESAKASLAPRATNAANRKLETGVSFETAFDLQEPSGVHGVYVQDGNAHGLQDSSIVRRFPPLQGVSRIQTMVRVAVLRKRHISSTGSPLRSTKADLGLSRARLFSVSISSWHFRLASTKSNPAKTLPSKRQLLDPKSRPLHWRQFWNKHKEARMGLSNRRPPGPKSGEGTKLNYLWRIQGGGLQDLGCLLA